jgi:thiamine-monophosphate kinase
MLRLVPRAASPNPKPALNPNPAGELALIEAIRRRAAQSGSPALRLGIGDDCAILTPPPGHDLLVTTDFSLEGRHFQRDWHPARSIGHRTLARGLSDLAAMGAHPLAAFLSLALPRAVAADPRWLHRFLDGLLALAEEHSVPLAGGDTAEAPGDHVLADIILLGTAPAGAALRRSGARPGDAIYVTGRLGGAAAELDALRRDPKSFRRATPDGHHPHLFPQPRLATGEALLRRGLATACIDLSDGLSTDLAHLCTASGVAAEIRLAALPRSPLLPGSNLHGASNAFARHALLHGGEDYELLFTASAKTAMPHGFPKTLGGVPLTRIGTILRSAKSRPQIVTIAANGTRTPLEPGGWEHFQ